MKRNGQIKKVVQVNVVYGEESSMLGKWLRKVVGNSVIQWTVLLFVIGLILGLGIMSILNEGR